MNANSNIRPRIWTVTFVNLIFISLAATVVVDAVQAALPIYISNLLHRDAETLAGTLVTVFALAGIIPFLASGAISDRIGPRRVLLVGSAIFLIGCSGPILFQGVGALFIWRVFQGVGFAIVNVASAAATSMILPRERLGEGLGYFGVGQALAMALGPCLGLVIVEKASATSMWITLAGLTAAILAASFWSRCDVSAQPSALTEVRRETRSSMKGFFGLFLEKRATIPSIMILILATGVCATIVFVGKYGQTLGFQAVGSFFVVMAASMLVSRFAMGTLMDKLAPTTILYPTLAFTALSFVMLAFVGNQYIFYLAGFPIGFGFGVATPLLASVAVKRSPRNRIGAANSMYYLCVNLGFGTGAFLGGIAIAKLGYSNAFLCGLACCLLPGIIAALFLRDSSTPDLELKREASLNNR